LIPNHATELPAKYAKNDGLQLHRKPHNSFLKHPSNSKGCIWCERLFFALNIGMSNLMPSIDRSDIQSVQQQARLFGCGSFNASILNVYLISL
jgi:hypothetical protein